MIRHQVRWVAAASLLAFSAASSGVDMQAGEIRSTRSLCYHIAQTLGAGRGADLASFVSVDEMAARVINALGLPPAESASLAGMLKPVVLSRSWFLKNDPEPQPWQVVGFRRGQQEDRCDVVMDVDGDAFGKLMFAQFFLAGDGEQPRIFDFMTSGIPVRANAQLAEAMALAPPRRNAPVLVARPDSLTANFQAFATAHGEGNRGIVHALYRGMPRTAQLNPYYLGVFLVNLNAEPEGERRRQMLETLFNAAGDQPGFGLWAMGYHFDRKDWNKALAAIDRFEADIGYHPQLDYLRMLMLHGQGSADPRFYAVAARALAHQDANANVYDMLMRQCILDNRFNDAVLVLDIFVERFGIPLDFALLAKYQNAGRFMKSATYRAWLPTYDARGLLPLETEKPAPDAAGARMPVR